MNRFLKWRIRHISNRNFILVLSVVLGFTSGFAAVLIKNMVYLIRTFLTRGFSTSFDNYLLIIYPAIGIASVLLLMNFVIKVRVGHGVPTVLHAISSTKGLVRRHNLYSSILTSTLTVGFGGSVGLEGPTVATGGAIGSNLGQLLHLSYRQIILLIGCASAGAMSAIFKAPIAAIVFVLEVIMLDLTMSSLVPLLLSSTTAALTSYWFLGQDVLYKVKDIPKFEMSHILLFVVLGLFTAAVSVYYIRVIDWTGNWFDRVKSKIVKWLIGGTILGFLVFLFPSLYGEGYEVINSGLNRNIEFLFKESPFFSFEGNLIAVIVLLFLLLFVKAIATGVTFGAGGVGGIFAPSLFAGMTAGILFTVVYNHLFHQHLPWTNFALVGMAGMVAGILHAPLTAIFLIAEITMAYSLFLPLMITATISYAVVKYFEPNSVYHIQLARRKQLFTHDKDKVVLSLMRVDKLIERNFTTIRLDATLGDLVKAISQTRRNIFPVVDDGMVFYGMVILDDIRGIMFRPELYENTFVRNLMIKPDVTIDPDDTVEEVVKKFNLSGKFNIPVIKDDRYIGFISRARLFSSYRQLLKKWSED